MSQRDLNPDTSLSAFFNFLLQDGEISNQEIREGLTAEGVDVQRVRRELKDLLQAEEFDLKTSWVRAAQKERARFQESVEKKRKELLEKFKNVKDLAASIRNGEFGLGLQSQFQVQFRNKNSKDLSKNDLIQLLDDQTILKLLEEETSDS